MKRTNMLLVATLPAFTIITLLALLALGPQIGGLDDMIAAALELAPVTMFAIAIGGSTTLAMRWAGIYLSCDEREDLVKRAGKGDKDAQHVLSLETVQWFGWMVLWIVVYLR